MRNKVFISHATPDDNEFTKWLALKLIGLGYEVWCDILFLEKAVDFWINIEKEIRENTIKFLIVSSTASNKREGVLKELAVATKVKKILKDDTFIVPLSIDESLSYDEINIEIVRINAIDFKQSWAAGLKDLIDFLERQNVPKEIPDKTKSNLLYQQIFLHNKGPIDKEEYYDSNWFPIISFPDELRFHDFGRGIIPKSFDESILTFPATKYKNFLCTFACEFDFMYHLPETESYDSSKTIRIPTVDILSGEYDSEFIRNSEAKKMIIRLTNKAFELRMKEKQVRSYKMSNKTGYWIEKDILEKDKFEKVLLVGKQKLKNWHFGISASGKLYPLNVLMISSHIFFTSDGKELIDSISTQHAARRRQGRNWWNDQWREKLLAFIKYLSDDDKSFYLEVGSEEKINVSNEPLRFYSTKSYEIPLEGNMTEDIIEVEITDTEEDIEEYELIVGDK